MTQDNKGDNNRNAGGNYNDHSTTFVMGDTDHPFTSNLPKKPPYEYEFIGRKNEIKEISQIITGGKGGYKLSIEGIGGLGKTTLVYEVCRMFLEQDIIKCALWFSAKTEDFTDTVETFSGNFSDTQSFLIEAVTLLGYKNNIHELSINELKTVFKQLLARQAKDKIIFVLDNLETVKDQSFFTLIKEMQYFQGDFFLIITSRNNLSIYNENCIVLQPLENNEMEQIINNFKRAFKVPKLLLDMGVILGFCLGNPLIARILVQKMLHSTGERIYQEYIKDDSIKGYEFLNYIFKNTYDSLSLGTQSFLLLLSHFKQIDDYILTLVEKILQDQFDGKFSISSSLSNELRKTFFVKYKPSNNSIFGIEDLGLEDFVYSFLEINRTKESMELYALLNIEIQKQRQRITKYEKIATDFGAKDKLEIIIISDLFDKENELKNKRITPLSLIAYLQQKEKTYPNIPYIPLVIARIYNHYIPDKLNETVTYGEKALKAAKRYLQDIEKLRHYYYPLCSSYAHGKLYDKNYALNKELVSKGLITIDVYWFLMRHETNIGQVELAFQSGEEGWNFIQGDFENHVKKERSKIENFIIGYYKLAVTIGDFERIIFLRNLIKKFNFKYKDEYIDLDDQFHELEVYHRTQGATRFRVRQLIKIYKTRLKNQYIQKEDFINFLGKELDADPSNGIIYYELYKQTRNPDDIFNAFKHTKDHLGILKAICKELIKFGGERIGEIPEYADIGISLEPNNINFYGYKGLFFSKNGRYSEAIGQFKIGIENYEKLSLSLQNNTENKKNYEECRQLMEQNMKRVG